MHVNDLPQGKTNAEDDEKLIYGKVSTGDDNYSPYSVLEQVTLWCSSAHFVQTN